ncbi:MAG: ATP-dependent helicase, partial [Propionibacteriaceae bacterium]|nr:ATP-dependent helicase [Propionibacteriaceae bacterium]
AGGVTQLAVTTVHALARSVLDRYGEHGDWRLLTAPEQEFRVRELLAGDQGDRWPEVLRPALPTAGFARQVRAVLARARQLGLDPEDVSALGAEAGLPAWQAVGEFFAEYLDVLDAEQVLDYAELVHRARLLLASPEVLVALRVRFDAVLVDDVTDLDPAQLGLLRELVPDGGRILATADPQAAVNTFRGAHPRVAAEFAAIFTQADGSPARVEALEQGHRFGGEIAAAVSRLEQRLPVASATIAAGLRPADRAGGVRVLHCASEAVAARTIAAELRRARIERGLDYHEMAVVTRSGRGLAEIARACALAQVPVRLAGDEIALAQAQAVRPLLLALEVSARGRLQPGEAIRLLSSPLGGFDPAALRQLVRQWRQAHPGARDALGQVPVPEEVLAAAVNQPGWLQATDPTPVRRRLARLVELLTAARAAVEAGERPDAIAWQLWQGTRWPARLRAEALAGGASGRQADRDLDAVAAFFEVAGESMASGPAGVHALLEQIAAQQIPADRERESRIGSGGVALLTAHRAKGREWELVIVAGAQEGSWPAVRQLSAVLEPERLLSQAIGPRPGARQRLTDERRLFRLACTRARSELVVVTSAGTEGEADQPSRFLAELGVEPEAVMAGPPVTPEGFVGTLRRALGSPDSAPPRRLAAAAELAALTAERLEDDRPLVPAADPANWWGVREISSGHPQTVGPIRLSPSQVSALLTCPRHYFLSRQARADPPPAVGASLGSVIHLLVQHAGTGALDEAAVGDYLDAAWQHLRFDTGWLSAVERVEAELSIGRFLAWRSGRDTEPLAVEAPFELDLEVDGRQVNLVGAVDRLERLPDGRLEVVDFKTGRTMPTRNEVAGMDQLGIYQLAVVEGGFEEIAGPRAGSAGASVVYLRHPGRPEALPREFSQDPLAQRPHLGDDPEEAGYPTWVHHRIARAAAVVAEGRFGATPGTHCRRCPFADSCPASGRGEQVLR